MLAGCGRNERAEDRPTAAEPSQVRPPAREDPDDVRKRECIATLTADAAPRVHMLLRSLCAEWVELKIPGVSLAIAEPGEPTLHAELGVRCFGEPAPIDASVAFRIGSVSKPVTAALALGLVEQQALTLDRRAATIPGFEAQPGLPPPRLDALLRHRSGLGEIEPTTLVELDGAWLPALARSPAAGSPGEYHYSNAGYSLVGVMLEQASGHRYSELVAERIADPLGLTSMTGDPTRANTSCGHLASDDERHPIRVRDDLDFMPGDPSWMSPAGGLLSSATDLASFALAIGTERLPGSEAMLEPGEPLPPEQVHAGHRDERYGLGLRSWQIDADTRAYGHRGNNVSFIAEMMFVPGELAIVILANRGVELPATLSAAETLLTAY